MSAMSVSGVLRFGETTVPAGALLGKGCSRGSAGTFMSAGRSIDVRAAVGCRRSRRTKNVNMIHRPMNVTTPNMTKITTNHSRARTSTSLFSCCVYTLTSTSPACVGCFSGIDLHHSIAKCLFDPRLMNRNDRLPLELVDEEVEPQTADAHERRDTHPGILEMLSVPRRCSEPVHVHVTHHENDDRDGCDR